MASLRSGGNRRGLVGLYEGMRSGQKMNAKSATVRGCGQEAGTHSVLRSRRAFAQGRVLWRRLPVGKLSMAGGGTAPASESALRFQHPYHPRRSLRGRAGDAMGTIQAALSKPRELGRRGSSRILRFEPAQDHCVGVARLKLACSSRS